MSRRIPPRHPAAWDAKLSDMKPPEIEGAPMAPRQTARRLLVAAPALALTAFAVTACSPPNEKPADSDAPYTLPTYSEEPKATSETTTTSEAEETTSETTAPQGAEGDAPEGEQAPGEGAEAPAPGEPPALPAP